MNLDRCRPKKLWFIGMVALAATLSAFMIACSGTGSPVEADVIPANGGPDAGAGRAGEFSTGANPSSTYLQLNQRFIEGVSTTDLDLDNVDAVFWHVFSKLPNQVMVYPSENYYYFILYVDRKQIWGNIRLAAGKRERGILSFAYFEYKESPYVTAPRVRKSKMFTIADDLEIEELDRFEFLVSYKGKQVTFNLHQLSQEQPKLFRLGRDEVSTMRTFDESGYQFFLLYNKQGNYFTWVLNEEELVPDQLVPIQPDLLAGRRSGFVFWIDPAHPDRKALVAIRGANATVNNYYDGPFDQLADNYVDETHIAEYMMLSSPGLRGRLDKYGYFTDKVGSSRLAISPYYVYFSDQALQAFVRKVRASEDPYFTISRRGRSPTPTPTP